MLKEGSGNESSNSCCSRSTVIATIVVVIISLQDHSLTSWWQVPALGTLVMTCRVTFANYQWEVGFCGGLYHIPKAPSSLLSLILGHLATETATASGQCVSGWELLDQLTLSRTLIYLSSDHLSN